MSVEAIRQLLHQGTAVSAQRAVRSSGLSQAMPVFSAQSSAAASQGNNGVPHVGQEGDTGDFALLLSDALTADTTSAASSVAGTAGFGGDFTQGLSGGGASTAASSATGAASLAAHAAYMQASAVVIPMEVTPDAGTVASPPSDAPWEIQEAIPATEANPLVQQPGLLGVTGNVEADELTERVLSLRMGRGLSAAPAIRDVTSAQTLLVSMGYDIGGYGPYANGVDGVLGPKTSQALSRFQQEQGLVPTGTLTAETATRLLAQGKPSLDNVSAQWQEQLAGSPFSAEAYEGTANPYWYVRFVAQGGDDPDTMGNIDPVFKGRLAALARDSGQQAAFGEGLRSLERQAWFYQKYVDGTGALAAKPGQSRHNMGLAVDTQSNWLQRMDEGKAVSAQVTLLRYGLCKPLANGEGRGREPWHLEPAEARG